MGFLPKTEKGVRRKGKMSGGPIKEEVRLKREGQVVSNERSPQGDNKRNQAGPLSERGDMSPRDFKR